MQIEAKEHHPRKDRTAPFPLIGGVDMDKSVMQFFIDNNASISFCKGDEEYWFEASIDGVKHRHVISLSGNWSGNRNRAWRSLRDKIRKNQAE